MTGSLAAARATGPGEPAPRRALLGDADAAAVRAIVAAIARDLASRRVERFAGGQDLVLADGEAGIAVFLAALPEHRAEAERRLARAVEGVTAGGMDASLHQGFAGIAWAWQHVHGRDDDPFEALDEALRTLVETAGAQLAPGLLFGLAGIALALLERPTPAADAGLVTIAAQLRARGQSVDRGLRWWLPSPPGTAYVDRFPAGFYDLGLDVGAAGIIAVCARIAARGVAVDDARAIVAQAACWMAAQDTAAGAPSKLDDHGREVHAFGWCKGELGMAMAMLGAANATGEPAYLERAVMLGRRAALVDPSRIEEPGFHIGAAGAMHAFERLYQATGAPELRDAALRWLVRLISLRQPDHGIGGFALASGELRAGLVSGAAGIGLSLLALVDDPPPTWNRVLGGPD